MTPYTVQQGDHLSSIAEEFGFHDYAVIWEHPQNDELRELRGDPNVIAPGDVVVVPDLEPKEVPCETQKRHRFRLHTRQLSLRVRLVDVNGEPLPGLWCSVRVENASYELATDGDGCIQTLIRPDAELGRITARDPEHGIDLDQPLLIGHLDPVELDSGVAARLSHLGYEVGDDLDRPDPGAMRLGIEEFQCDHGLPVTGEADPETRARLQELHGV